METSFLTKAAIAILVLLVAVFGYRLMHPATTFAADGIDSDWDAAVQRSRDSHQPTVLLFTADWCPACRALHAGVLSRSDVRSELYDHFNYFVVDLTHPSMEVQQHARKFGVSAIPTLIRYDTEGKETARAHYLPPDEMMAWLKDGE